MSRRPFLCTIPSGYRRFRLEQPIPFGHARTTPTTNYLDRSRKGCKPYRTAFTLIELLIVIAIIAILAGMLPPALSRSKAKAQTTRCLANQKRISLGYLLYTEDNDDSYPQQLGWGAGGGRKGTNATKVAADVLASFGRSVAETNRPPNRYVGNVEVFHCPSDRGDTLYGAKNCWLEYGNSYCTTRSIATTVSG